MEEDNPKKAFECFEESIKHNPNNLNGTDIYYHRGQGLHCRFFVPESAAVCSRLMISISFYIMNEFAKAVENFIIFSEDDQFVFCHIQLAIP
jgi:mitochondrial import receptor subunit TOM70